MNAEITYFFYLFGSMSLVSEVTTNVSIHSTGGLGDIGTVQCGSKITFICNIPAYKYSMTWVVDFVIVAECILSECSSTDLENITFSFNTSTGIFRMAINPVTFAINEKVIICEDGTTSTDVTINVIVLPEQSDITLVDSRNLDTINITVETGCVYPSVSVAFDWYYYKTDIAPVLYHNVSQVEDGRGSDCTAGRCGGHEITKKSSTLTIPDEHDGDDCFLQVRIRHMDVRNNEYNVIVNTTRTYKLKGTTTSEAKIDNKPNYGLIIGLTVVCICALVVVAFAIRVIKYNR